MSELDYRAFDCDNHYYEAPDAFTRHVPKAMQGRCVQWAEIDGRKHHLVGGKLARAVTNPTWNPIAKPGAISDFLRGNPNDKDPRQLLRDREPLPGAGVDDRRGDAGRVLVAQGDLRSLARFPLEEAEHGVPRILCVVALVALLVPGVFAHRCLIVSSEPKLSARRD